MGPGSRFRCARDDVRVSFQIQLSNQREDVRPHSRGADNTEFASIFTPRKQEGAGKADARCTRGLVCKRAQ